MWRTKFGHFLLKRSFEMHPLLIVFIVCTAQICSSQDDAKPLSDTYKSCCGIEPVTFNVGKANVYVPNVFTPNGDGINDLFLPTINSEVKALINFTIINVAGDTVLFNRRDVILTDPKSFAWDGKRYDGKQHVGPFKYGMAVYNKNNELGIVEGKGCVIPCTPEMAVFRSKEGCFYPIQAGKEGTLDKSINTAEKGCF
ncbi:gliding motility-associated C-terminal domain-containing protein [Dyadobacter psychrotolerans]|uniref:WG repeat-containing protein n=1 Tax=Dyadobacter psychrotolerans TaxID=2541721 RepID=A0A4R5DJG7_9BACT|nr:gliding motility-associated C-terminal domain-containing protein [Dyadobacter psychrotolerans]TDE12104.1 hypothetical protein E0F88_23965 [Dyadobacter psychrotolerans]